ncbi:hypothetical protein PV327_003506 [Microctonus hyperodae]|uniref:Peptidase M13 N-terminal domain-containing protein n=1 Tax=Microctonus hyperodae TaxID=165561 RepID=A0AA39G5R6_MICHY|nr:hypothetical protein PV327_003506 [Microctonus hyperodae]
MNTTAIEKQGSNTLLKIFEKLGGWPVIDGSKWNESNFNWIELMYKFKELGYSMNYFFKLCVGEDAKNNSRNVLYLSHPGYKLFSKYLVKGRNDNNVKIYYKFMIDIAVMLGADRKRAEIELEETLNFEIKFANISLLNDEQRNASLMYNPITLSDLIKKYTYIPWREYINTLFSHHLTFNDNELIIIESPQFLQELEKLITTTPNRILANYAIWKITEDSILYLNEKIRQVQLDYSKSMYGIIENKSRWSECLEIVQNQLEIALEYLDIGIGIINGM